MEYACTATHGAPISAFFGQRTALSGPQDVGEAGEAPLSHQTSPATRLVNAAGQTETQRVYHRQHWKVLGTYSTEGEAKAAMRGGSFGRWRAPGKGETTGKTGDRRYICNLHVGCKVSIEYRLRIEPVSDCEPRCIGIVDTVSPIVSCLYRSRIVPTTRQVPARIKENTEEWSFMVYTGIAHTEELLTKKRKNFPFTVEQEEAFMHGVKHGEDFE